MDTVTLTIDGRQVTVAKGKTVLQAAIENGMEVPYYCYHPGIGIDGSCRVCIVKIEKMPKLQTSCSTTCTEGMVVSTNAPEVVQARAGVFEFLLVNHPLDCPVCDKGGECPLQDFSYNFGPAQSRTDFPRRVFDGEGVKGDVDFGPTLMLNRQRCILCTRCVRFMREIDGDAQINIIDRGYGSEIATFQEEGVHSLISGNLMDVCPVGAITTRDYRFKARPWDNPSAVDTICTRCEKGCNTTAWLKAKPEWAKGSRLVRFTPRFVPEVNGYWMCDIGRFDYHWIESDDRLRKPMMKDGRGTLQPVAWHDLYRELVDKLSAAGRTNADGVRFLLSAHASHEELFLFRRLAEELVGHTNGVTATWTSSKKPQPSAAKFVVPEVDAPNVAGVRAFGLGNDVAALKAAVEAGAVSALYVFDPGRATLGDTHWILSAREKGTLPLLIVQGVLISPLTAAADFVLPGASSLEKEASYTNEQGRLQAASRALPLVGDSMEDWQLLVNLANGLGVTLPHRDAAAVRADIAARFAGVNALDGIAALVFGQPMEGRHWLETNNPSERWKWDFMYQDLPPVKGSVELTALPSAPVAVIPLKEVK
ncbi:MAG TPA: 2Fe-2S iron-sulfur cluster-binding protein [Vicinamibacterales bacterium]|nr:2Fe-2S iron-sulfur cluster-binding protein [Vicinamibacterales bacterium]